MICVHGGECTGCMNCLDVVEEEEQWAMEDAWITERKREEEEQEHDNDERP